MKNIIFFLIVLFVTLIFVSCKDDPMSQKKDYFSDTTKTTQPAKIEVFNLPHDGAIRIYTVFLPKNYKPNMPVVLNLHSANNTMTRWMKYTRMNNVADAAGFIVVYPLAIDGHWNGSYDNSSTDDVGFISALIDTLEIQYNIDMARIYCTGGSSGGFMTYRLLGELGHRFAAVAPVAGVLTDFSANWKPIQAIPLLIIHGTADNNVSYYGSRGGVWWPVGKTIEYWLRNYSCSLQKETLLLPDIDTTDNCTIEKISWTDCSNNSSIIHYKVIGGAHHMPGGNVDHMRNPNGNLNNDINSSVEMWNFFKNYSNPLVNMAFSKIVEVDFPTKLYLSHDDTLTIKSHLSNPENHPGKVYALISGENHSSQISLELFDDGLHGDGDASDNFYGVSKLLSGMAEDDYEVEIYTDDLTTGTSHLYHSKFYFRLR